VVRSPSLPASFLDEICWAQRKVYTLTFTTKRARSWLWEMCEASPQRYRTEAKRRKVRKGTQSCWECKRRKVRCIFGSPASIICDNCKRRRTSCISQEYPDQEVPSATSDPIEARLGRVEALVKQLAQNAGFFQSLQSPGSPARDLPETQQVSPAPEHGKESRERAVSTISNTAVRFPTLSHCSKVTLTF
jgi:hypothetical protein